MSCTARQNHAQLRAWGLVSLSGGLVIAVVLIAPRAWATTFLAPARPLTKAEALEYAYAEADLVVVGQFQSTRESWTSSGTASRPSIEKSTIARLRSISSQKGRPHASVITLGQGAEPLPVLLDKRDIRTSDSVLVFLRTAIAVKSESEAMAKASGLDTTLFYPVDDPSGVAGGVLKLEGESGRSILQQLELIRTKLTPEAMGAEADLVIIGRPTSTVRSCETFGVAGHCRVIAVESIVSGVESSDSIAVFALTNAVLPGYECSAFYFLRRGVDGAYEIMHFRAGVLPIAANVVPQLGESVGSVVRRIRDSKSGSR